MADDGRFVANLSHELRTPLTTIHMAAEVLYESRRDFAPDARRAAELLNAEVERFEALLSDLLEISRFDSGAAVMSVEPVEVGSVVSDVVAATAPLAAARRAAVQLHADRPVVITADRVRLARIVRNLVTNAVVHAGGHIDVTVTATEAGPAPAEVAGDGPGQVPDAPAPTGVVVTVADAGPGLGDDTAAVFERFWRADPSRARDTGGAGLGLAIAAEDTLLHGGCLRGGTNDSGGATFTVWLPDR